MKDVNIMKISGSVIAFITLLVLVFSSMFTVDQGERGVLLRNGAIIGTSDPGLSFKVPMIDTVKFISVQNNVRNYAKVSAYSKDQQTADIAMSVSFRISPDKVSDVYSQYGSVEGVILRVLDRKVQEQVKTVFGQFNAVNSIQERSRLNSEVETAIKNAIGTNVVVVESVQIENLDFSDAYEDSIEKRMLAEVEVQKLRQNAEREKVQAQIAVTQATAKADSVKIAAEAEAESIRVKGNAEADAIKARGDALRENPNLVDLTKAERWDGKLPTTVVPNGTLPFLDVK